MSFLINPFAFAVAGGDFESIATVTVGSGGASSIQFTSIPATFAHLQVRGIARTARTGATPKREAVYIQFNGDTGSNYAYHNLLGTGAAAQAGAAASTDKPFSYDAAADDNAAGLFGAMIIDILDYADTSKNTVARRFGGADLNGSGNVGVGSALWVDTDAVTSISLHGYNGNNFVQYTTCALFGVKAP